MAAGKYRTIVADPPWPYPEGFPTQPGAPHKQDRELGASRNLPVIAKPLPYRSMEIRDMEALPLRDLAAENCRLFLWATNRFLPIALCLIRQWGFAYKQTLIWDKRPNVNPFGGSVAPNAAEFLIAATIGTPPRLLKWQASIVTARKARTVHSVKPDAFLDLVEQVSPGPYLEMFARRNRLGWDTWGDEALEHVQITGAA